MRAERLGLLVLFVGIVAGASACAGLAGLTQYSDDQTVDSSVPTKPKKDASGPATPDAGEDAEGMESGDDALESGTGDEGDDAGDGEAGDGNETEAAPPPDGEAPDAESADSGEAGTVGQPDAGADAGDGGGSPGTDAGDGGCTPVTHSNGVGQNYVDCAPLNTYGADEGARACAAADAGPCVSNAALCANAAMECTTTAAFCKCWGYSGSISGHVSSSLAGPICVCPANTDPTWR